MILDTHQGGNVAVLNEVSDDQKTTSFSSEFKQEAADLVLDQRYFFAQACTSLGMGESALQRWVQQLAKERERVTPRNKALTPERRRIQELEVRCRRLKSEQWDGLILTSAVLLLSSVKTL